MSSLEVTKDIVIAMLQNKNFTISKETATSIANTYEIIYNKVEELRTK